jgi:transcription-repair coupling factor (superfamily II helicase)
VQGVKDDTKLLAQDILRLYAARNEVKREPCPPDGDLFRAFEAAFEFAPTPDQEQCFQEIASDMIGRVTPMDRLVCGDVGFGKTEVAMRAIYRAVLSNRQVAFLAPTTVLGWHPTNIHFNVLSNMINFIPLAAQHFRNLKKRMPGVSVEFLRGGTTQTTEGKRVREAMESGQAQVIIGTHALFNKKAVFKKLEFLVVDEEQRFGVAQKERFKAMATGVECSCCP